MMFSKRHYEAIAAVMRQAHPIPAGEPHFTLPDFKTASVITQWSETCKDLAEMFEKDNPKFDIVKFMKACKPEPDPVRVLLDPRKIRNKSS